MTGRERLIASLNRITILFLQIDPDEAVRDLLGKPCY